MIKSLMQRADDRVWIDEKAGTFREFLALLGACSSC